MGRNGCDSVSYENAELICDLCSKAEQVFDHDPDIDDCMLPGIIVFDSVFLVTFLAGFHGRLRK